MSVRPSVTKKVRERYLEIFGGELKRLREYWTNSDAFTGLMWKEPTGTYIELGTFRLKVGLDSRSTRPIEVIPRLFVREGLLRKAMRVVQRRRFLRLGILSRKPVTKMYSLVVVRKGDTFIAVAPLYDVRDKGVELRELCEKVPPHYDTLCVLRKLEA